MQDTLPAYPLFEMELPELDITEGCGYVSHLYGVFEYSGADKHGWSCLHVEGFEPHTDRRGPLPAVIRDWVIDQVNKVQRDLVNPIVQEFAGKNGIRPDDNDTPASWSWSPYAAGQRGLASKCEALVGNIDNSGEAPC